jgi:hypothetical protein
MPARVEASDGDEGPEDRGTIYPSPRPYDVVPGVEGDKVRTRGKYASLLDTISLNDTTGREAVGVYQLGVGGGVSI